MRGKRQILLNHTVQRVTVAENRILYYIPCFKMEIVMHARTVTCGDVILPRGVSWVRDVLLILLGSVLIALAGQLSVKLPGFPVAFVLASHVCLALGVVLGKWRGAAAVCAYLAQGAMGLPVFAAGGSGLLYLMGPSGGYLIGWVFAAYFTGYFVEKMRIQTPLRLYASLAVGNAAIFAFGVLHLSRFIGLQQAVLLGVAPFLIVDGLKLIVTERVLRWAR